MTSYPAPPGQLYGAGQADVLTRLRTLEQQVAQMAAPQLLARVVVGASTASVRLPDTGSLPQNFTNLRVVLSAKSDGTGGTSGYDNATLQFNGVTAGSYNWSTWYSVQGAGAVSTAGGTSQTSMQCAAIWNGHFGSAGRGIATIEIPNYSDSTNLKSFEGHSAASDGGVAGVMQLYSGTLGGATTGPITYLTFLMGVGNFVPGSTFTAYGS